MIKYLKYIDWALFIFNIVIFALFIFTLFISPTRYAAYTLSERIGDLFGYAFIYGYPIVWIVLWQLKKHHITKSSPIIWTINTFFFVISLIFLLTEFVDFNIFRVS